MANFIILFVRGAVLISVVVVIASAVRAAADGTNVVIPGQMAATEERAEDAAAAYPTIFGAATAVAPAGGSGYVALTYANPHNG